ncbi:MAG: hypothetical protein JXB48_05820 [Candidatus Latescibacteria bacterium]|nr:hypothetical protein [Candidatus Latescibacterota bacterium]
MNRLIKKENILFVVFIICIGSLINISGCNTTQPQQKEMYFPKLDNYADLYLRGSYDLLHMMRVRELGKIGEATKIAAQRKLAGGTIWSNISTPHIMYAGACDEDVPGNPNIAPDYNINHPKHPRQGGFPELGKGDFLITAGTGKQDVRNKGCYFLGIGYPMSTNRYSPPAFNDHAEITMESQVDMMIYTWGPKEDGFVTPALTPHLKICPTSPMTVVAYWLITAQLAHNLAYTDTSGSYEAAEQYLDILMKRLATFHANYIDDVNIIGKEIADRVLSGGKLYVHSSRWEFYYEAGGTAGSLMGIYPIHPGGFYTSTGSYSSKIIAPAEFKPEELTPKDVVVLAMAGATPEIELGLAKQIRGKNAYLVGIYPFDREDGFSTAPLGELCDVSLDNVSGDKYGVLEMPGYEDKIIPTMAMMNNYAFWAIIGAYVQNMEAQGVAPYYWMSWHVPGGKAYTDSIHVHFLERGY